MKKTVKTYHVIESVINKAKEIEQSCRRKATFQSAIF